MSTINHKSPVADGILNQAEQYAQSVLPQAQPAAPSIGSTSGLGDRTVHHIHHYDPFYYYPRYYPSQPVVNVQCGNSSAPTTSSSSSSCSSSSRSERKKSDSDDTAGKVIVFVALAAGFVALCGLIGNAARELKKGDEQIQNLNAQMSLADIEGTRESVQKVVDLQKKMIHAQSRQDKDDIWRMAKMAGCTSVAMVGLGVPYLLGLGAMATAGYGAAWIFQKGMQEGDTSAKENAVRLLGSVAEARIAIQA